MAQKKLEIKDVFHDQEVVSVRNLSEYWLRTDGISNRGTVDWRINDLKQKKVLQEIKSGLYTFVIKPVYTPIPDKLHIILNKTLHQNYRDTLYSIWNISWLNEFSVHQFNHDNVIIEIEKDLQESLRNLLEQKGYFDLAWKINTHRMQLTGIKKTIYILSLPTRSPIRKMDLGKITYPVPSLEKILVDIYDNDEIFYFLQGAELENIFEYALTKYAINFTTLFSYAQRRNKAKTIKEFIKNNYPFLPKIVLE